MQQSPEGGAAPLLARRMWSLFEPVQAVTYFTPEAGAACTGAGVRGFWRSYLAGRVALLDGPLARLWHAATVLREHRGDGHVAALVAAGLDGCEALVLRAGLDLSREMLQPIKGWADADWERAAGRLTRRGWLAPDGRLTAAGAAAHRAVEQATDLAAARPWATLRPGQVAELLAVLVPVARICAAALPYPNPVGMPAPELAAG